jgi:release factor glutamine methyltransferase
VRVARSQRKALASQLTRAGFVDGREEAREIIAAADGDPDIWHALAARRLDGEPLAWLRGFVIFAGRRVRVDRGVYVPRPQTEQLAQCAVALLPERGLAADLCTGSGALAVVLGHARPGARILATDIDPAACRCARSNGVDVYRGHLAEPLPKRLAGQFDLVVAVAPYVPTEEMIFLPRDVRQHEPREALDGGSGGLVLLEQVVESAARLLHAGGSLLLELGGRQDELLLPALRGAGFEPVAPLVDDEGDLRGLHARLA